MALDMQTALSQYGYVAQLANMNPDIKATLDRAVAEEWDSARFERELMNTGWYKSLSERRRAIEVQKATDPATWNQTLGNKAQQISVLATRMGLPGVDAQRYAQIALENEWTDDQLREFIADTGKFFYADGALGGEAGELETYVRKTFQSYGLPLSDGSAIAWSKDILAGRKTTGGMVNEARNWAKKAYPPFADQLDSGMTMLDIADPYMQTMANTLELSGGAVKLSDPHVKRALQGKDGQPLAMWEFERSLKDDARWQSTKQAKNETYATLQQVGADWGFL